jgi:hypothetical protein
VGLGFCSHRTGQSYWSAEDRCYFKAMNYVWHLWRLGEHPHLPESSKPLFSPCVYPVCWGLNTPFLNTRYLWNVPKSVSGPKWGVRVGILGGSGVGWLGCPSQGHPTSLGPPCGPLSPGTVTSVYI